MCLCCSDGRLDFITVRNLNKDLTEPAASFCDEEEEKNLFRTCRCLCLLCCFPSHQHRCGIDLEKWLERSLEVFAVHNSLKV